MGMNSRNKYYNTKESYLKDMGDEPANIEGKSLLSEAYDKVLSRHGRVTMDDLATQFALMTGNKIPDEKTGTKIGSSKILSYEHIEDIERALRKGHSYVAENVMEVADTVISPEMRKIEDAYVLGRIPKTKNLLDEFED